MQKEIKPEPKESYGLITIEKQQDGNWTGKMLKFGKVIEARQSDPQIVLQLLLTNDGQ